MGFFLCCSFCSCAFSSSFLSASSTFRGLRRGRRRRTKTKDNNIERILFIRLDFYSGHVFVFSFSNTKLFKKNSVYKKKCFFVSIALFQRKMHLFCRNRKFSLSVLAMQNCSCFLLNTMTV